MIEFETLISNTHRYPHHALLMVCNQFETNDFPDKKFAQLANVFCGIALDPRAPPFEAAKEHPDIFVADKERKILRLEDLEPIQKTSFYPPMLGKKRLFLIEHCERMNAHAANALLKTLEEPHASALFLLTTHNLNLLQNTIISRAQKVSIFFQEIKKSTRLEQIESAHFLWIAEQVNAFSTAPLLFSMSLHTQTAYAIPPKVAQETLEMCEKIAKQYEASTLRDGIIHHANERLKRDPAFLQNARALQNAICTWQQYDGLNPSRFLWLTRIFLTLRSSFSSQKFVSTK